MSGPKRIQRRRSKGWRMPENAIYVGRPTQWGNPFVVGRDGTAQRCVDLYRYLAQGYVCVSTHASVEAQTKARRAMAAAMTVLRGKDLACWCPLGRACHADVLLEIANGGDQKMRQLPESDR